MKNNAKSKIKYKKNTEFIIILITVAFWSIIAFFGLLTRFEARFYDILLSLKKAPVERQEILLVDIDDTALSMMGKWPWPRDKIADCLLMMKELDASTVVFDIEYLSPSEETFDKELYAQIIENPQENISNLPELLKDNDDYFARAIQFFGNSWLTINSGNLDLDIEEKDLEYAKKRFLRSVTDTNKSFDKLKCSKKYNSFSPTLHKILKNAQGAGFTNVLLDKDGVRRRIRLLVNYPDGALAQLSFAPVLDILTPEKIELKGRTLILYGCSLPDGTGSKDIKIPLDKDGSMYINWIKKAFASTKIELDENGNAYTVMDKENTSFNHCSIYHLWNLADLEKTIASDLSTLYSICNAPGYVTLLQKYQEILEYKTYLLSCMQGLDKENNIINGGIDQSSYQEYFALKKAYFESVQAYMESDEFAQTANQEEFFNNHTFMNYIQYLSEDLDTYNYTYQSLIPMFYKKFCIIGDTGTGTTDLGSTPFSNAYPNVGTHANVYNTIMNQDFIYPLEWYWGLIPTIIFSVLAFCFHSKRKVWLQAVIGFELLAIIFLISALLMIFANVYLPVFTQLTIAFTTFILETVYRFRSSEKDKKFITNAFSQCLSKDVVNEIIKDPSKLKLGGQNVEMSAIFTDIQKFSGFSELLSADELVELLNYYLTRMSEIIMNEHGTVDKYEGDAIVAFFGAPVHMKDHASRACLAAIKMKEAEEEINKTIQEIVKTENKDAVNPTLYSAFYIMVHNNRTIFTRIGINSGSIVAGFMGSENKKNYTVMGNNVNLASRLEGVNKQYRTNGILISEATRMELDDRFIVRSLDRVQVVNVKTPIRLYEVLALKDGSEESLVNYVAAWEQTIKTMESENYTQALAQFEKLLTVRPDDNTCKYYIELLKKFFIQGKFPTVQDDFGVAYNNENPSDMDPSWVGTKKEIKGTFTLLQK